MATTVERAKDWWELKAPRERRLLVALAATLVVCLLAWVAMTIRGGLNAIEGRNQKTRDALAAIELRRLVSQNEAGQQSPAVAIPDRPIALDTYLDDIITEIGLKSPAYPTPKDTQNGDLHELSFRVSLQDLTIYQLKDLLEKVETKNPVVAVTELHVKRSFRDQEKLDVDLTVLTFYKKGAASAAPAEGGEGKADDGSEG
jgi:hypothetical protein